MSNKKKILIIQKVHEKGMELINNHPNFDVEVTDDTSIENLKSKLKDCDGASIRIAKLPGETFEEAQNLKSFLNSNSMNLIFTDLNSDNKKIEKTKFSDEPICIIIGPEGDFSEHERQEILSFKGVQALKINDNILRSETAVISAISIINYVIN